MSASLFYFALAAALAGATHLYGLPGYERGIWVIGIVNLIHYGWHRKKYPETDNDGVRLKKRSVLPLNLAALVGLVTWVFWDQLAAKGADSITWQVLTYIFWLYILLFALGLSLGVMTFRAFLKHQKALGNSQGASAATQDGTAPQANGLPVNVSEEKELIRHVPVETKLHRVWPMKHIFKKR